MKNQIILLFLSFTFIFFRSAGQQVDIIVQTGHSATVNEVAFSNNGKYVASACTDGSVKLWDAKLGFEVFTFYDFSERGTGVHFSPDSKYLLGTGSIENVLWDVATGRKLARIETEDEDEYTESEVTSAIFSNDNKYCFSGREGNSILRWDVKEMLHPENYKYPYDNSPYTEDSVVDLEPPASAFFYNGHTGYIKGLCVSADNKYLVSISDDSTIRVWDIESGKQLKRIKNSFPLSALAITSDGKRLITSDKDMSGKTGIRIWDITSGKQILFIPDQAGYVNTISLSADNKFLVAGTLTKNILLYSFSTGKLIKSLNGHTSWINSLAFSGDGKFIVSGSEDASVKIWHAASGRMLKDLRKTIANIDNLVYENKHRFITTTSNENLNQQTLTWEMDQGIGIKNRYSSKGNLYNDEFLSMDTSGKLILLTEDSSFIFYEPVSGKLINKYTRPFVGTASLSPGGNLVYFQDKKNDSLYTVETATGRQSTFAAYPGKDSSDFFKNINSFAFSPDGKVIAAGTNGPDIFLFNRVSKKYLRNLNYLDADSSERKEGTYQGNESLALPNAQINDLKFSPDGKLIAAGVRMPDPVTTGGIIIIWETETGKMLHWKPAHNYIIQSINWSADGKYLVTGSNDKWLKVWAYKDFKEADFKPVFVYRNDFTPLHTSFTKDNDWLISAGIDGKVIIRDAASYQQLVTLIGLNSSDYIAVTKDQYYAASRKGTQLIAFRQGNKVFPAEQFDIRFNRPDKVMEILGSPDTNLIKSYRSAYYKRVKKFGIDTSSFRNDFTTPDFDFVDRDNIGYQQNLSTLQLKMTGSDSVYKLNRFNVWVNDVPLYGQRGISLLDKSMNRFDTAINIKLSIGENRIETSVTNENGTESYRTPLLVNYDGINEQAPMTYFIGIGIDHYADNKYDLLYSTKDIRDLAARLKQKKPGSVFIDTLFNEQVTVSNIRKLKDVLAKTNINDRIIISYSGHGLLDKKFDYFLSTYNINFDDPVQNGLAYDELESLLDNIPARKKLLLIDACHSGEVDKDELITLNAPPDSLKLIKGLKPVGYKDENHFGLENSFELMQNLFVGVGKSTGATIISAASGTQFALERNDLQNGVFTFSILEAMKKFRSIRLSELKKYVGERVFNLTNGLQRPTSRNETIANDWEVW